MKIKLVGHKVLIKLEEYEHKSKGGIILGDASDEKREVAGRQRGRVVRFGPLAFKGLEGINDDRDATSRASQYGIEIGDLIELERYDGNQSSLHDKIDSLRDYRVVNDNHIIFGYEDGEEE